MTSESFPLPWFLSITGVEGVSFGKMSPFLIAKGIYGIVGDVKSVKKWTYNNSNEPYKKHICLHTNGY